MFPQVLPTYNRTDVGFVRGEGPYLFAEDGQRYLDFTAGIAVNAFGHANPRLIAALTAQVAALRRTVETLADMLVRSGAINDEERRELVRVGRRTHDVTANDDAAESDEDQRVLVGSPYRGSSPVDGTGCAVCGKALTEDDPELALGKHGKVCTMCFTRGG